MTSRQYGRRGTVPLLDDAEDAYEDIIHLIRTSRGHGRSPRHGSEQRRSDNLTQDDDYHEDIEHTIPPGADGIIECIEYRARPQGLTFTIWIPVNEVEDRGIVNFFDESDGTISTFITAEENT